jgi:O-antigen ligase
LQRQLLLLSIPVVFALLWWARPTLQVVAIGIAVNAVAFGVYSMFAVLPGRERGEGLGVTHMILFGNAGLLLGFASLALVLLKPSWPWRILGSGGPGFGLASSILSLVPRRMVGHSAFGGDQPGRAPQEPTGHHDGSGVGIGLVATTSMILLLNTGIVQDRIAQGERDVELLTDGNFQTSLGLRILMWKIALETGLEAPLLGQGFSGYAQGR